MLRGVVASRGLALGPVHLLHGGGAFPAPPASPGQGPELETARFLQALEAAHAAIARDRASLVSRAGKAEAEIMDAHLALLEDEALIEPIRDAIAAGASAERAAYDAAQALAARYRELEEPLLAERAVDVLDVGRRLCARCAGEDASAPAATGIVDRRRADTGRRRRA